MIIRQCIGWRAFAHWQRDAFRMRYNALDMLLVTETDTN